MQQAGQLEKARAAYEQAAQSQEKIGSAWHAAKHMETCSAISKDLAQFDRVADFSRQAGSLYAAAGRMAAGELAEWVPLFVGRCMASAASNRLQENAADAWSLGRMHCDDREEVWMHDICMQQPSGVHMA
jgi:hypothetical protein